MKLKKRLASFVVAGLMAVVPCVSLASSAATHLKYDANNDGIVNLADAVYVQQYLNGGFEPENLDRCDVDRNGVVSSMDVNKIQCYCIGLLDDNDSVEDNVNNANTVNSNLSYFVYDAKTGEPISEHNYMLTKLGPSRRMAGVIDGEDRVIDWTKSGVVKLMNDNHYIGTGFVVGDHVIATAAHCAYNKKISEILMFDDSGNIKLHATPVESHVPFLFTVPVNDYEPCNYDYDYALITVNEDLSTYPHFDLGVPLDTFTDKHMTISTTGFPEKVLKNNKEVIVNNNTLHNMYTGNGTFLDMNSYKVSYKADTTPGNSGGPAYITESLQEEDDDDYTVFAINTYYGDTQNGGVRITTDLIHFYKNNRNINWEVS
ncbi:MAG: trypsin-like serine protease [Ruminococcus sp.]|nr:trypsin-like serine protease [Ruminococcus sp.]